MEPRKETNREPKTPAASGASKAPRKQQAQSGAGTPGAGAGAQPQSAGAQAGVKTQGMQGQATGTQPQAAAGTQQGGAKPPQNEDLLQHAKHATGEIVNQVQQRAGSQFNERKQIAADDLSKVAKAVRQFGQNLVGEETGPIARYAAEYGDKAAQNIERFTNYIREQDPKQLLDDVQNFGRRRPGLLLGGAFLLGLAGARLIKSSLNAASQQTFNPNTARQPSGNAR